MVSEGILPLEMYLLSVSSDCLAQLNVGKSSPFPFSTYLSQGNAEQPIGWRDSFKKTVMLLWMMLLELGKNSDVRYTSKFGSQEQKIFFAAGDRPHEASDN